MDMDLASYAIDYATPTDAVLQAKMERIDAAVRQPFGLAPEHTNVGLLDLRSFRLAMIHPDRIEYAASVPKIGILLAWFDLHPEAVTHLSPQMRRELGLMIKVSSNEMATKYSRELGLAAIQRVLEAYGFYDRSHGGGIWMGKHYGQGGERIGDPIGDHSHAATVRQLVRFYLMLAQGRLVSAPASEVMRAIFASPEIPHERNKFVKGLAGRPVEILRKSGSWEEWLHDTAIVAGPGRHYILVALTRHPRSDDYLAGLAEAVDDMMTHPADGT